MKFRYHRGGFAESMNTMLVVRSPGTLEDVLLEICRAGFSQNIRDLQISYYSYDDRLQSHSYIVCHKVYGPIGFLWDI